MYKKHEFIPIDRLYCNFDDISDNPNIKSKIGADIRVFDRKVEELEFVRVGYGQVVIKGMEEKIINAFRYFNKDGEVISVPFNDQFKNLYKLKQFKALGTYEKIKPVFVLLDYTGNRVIDIDDYTSLSGTYKCDLIGFLVKGNTYDTFKC